MTRTVAPSMCEMLNSDMLACPLWVHLLSVVAGAGERGRRNVARRKPQASGRFGSGPDRTRLAIAAVVGRLSIQEAATRRGAYDEPTSDRDTADAPTPRRSVHLGELKPAQSSRERDSIIGCALWQVYRLRPLDKRLASATLSTRYREMAYAIHVLISSRAPRLINPLLYSSVKRLARDGPCRPSPCRRVWARRGRTSVCSASTRPSRSATLPW